jgi:ETS factor family protein
LPSLPFFSALSASCVTPTSADGTELFESRCAANLTSATPTNGFITSAQFPAATSALLAAAFASSAAANGNAFGAAQLHAGNGNGHSATAEQQLGAFVAAALAAGGGTTTGAASVNNTSVPGGAGDSSNTNSTSCASGGSSSGASTATSSDSNSSIGGFMSPTSQSQLPSPSQQPQQLTANDLGSAVGNPFLSQQSHHSAFQLVRSPQSVVPHSLLQSPQLPQQPPSLQSHQQQQQADLCNPPPQTVQHSQVQQSVQHAAEVNAQQHMAAAAAAALYPQLMCLPVLLDRLGPHILRSHMSTSQFKPIPNNERVDLARFRIKEPQEWATDDVVAWMLDVARRHRIPFENLNMHKFATCTGPLLMLMNEHSFKERDPTYGSLLYNEFRKLLNDDSFVDEWMRAYKESEESVQVQPNSLLTPKVEVQDCTNKAGCSLMEQSYAANMSSMTGFLAATSPLSPLMQPLGQAAAACLHAASEQSASTSSHLLHPQPTYALLQQASPGMHQTNALRSSGIDGFPHSVASTSSDCEDAGDESVYHGVNSKIRKNKDGKPRKRSQHTKGNKLWEFIRDALKDPTTCPSVVRWEDPVQGVFRIVESEKLARLWGERKNNQKMTYEKLSRAMRTYYEKQILVPVPKTGLYPKKLVYKFGPGAHGWSAPPQLVAAAMAANLMEESGMVEDRH